MECGRLSDIAVLCFSTANADRCEAISAVAGLPERDKLLERISASSRLGDLRNTIFGACFTFFKSTSKLTGSNGVIKAS